MMNEHLIKLNEMIRVANTINNPKKKIDYIFKLSSYGSFIYYSGYINADEYEKAIRKLTSDPTEEVYRKQRNIAISDLVSNNESLNVFYYKTLLLYAPYKLVKYRNIASNVNIEKHFLDFLKYLNIFSLYEEIVNKKMLSYNPCGLGYSICISNRDDSYIVMNESDGLYRYLTLVHEMAHALENRVLHKRIKFFDAKPTTEIMAISLTRIFMEYLKENKALTEDEITIIRHNFDVNYYHFITWSFLITEGIKYNAFDIDDYDISLYIKNNSTVTSLTDHNYSLGSLASFTIFHDWQMDDKLFIQNLPDMIREIDRMNISKILTKYDSPTVIQKELDKTLIKK